MDVITTVLIAFGLAADAFAASITSGIKIKRLRIKNALMIATFFGFFQAIMPLVGWLVGRGLKGLISEVDHWVAFGLLGFVGCRMIYESIHSGTTRKELNPLNVYVLLTLSVATSIDALVVGISFAFLQNYIATLVISIGVVTFILSFIGVFVGNRFGNWFNNKIEIVGGLILIFIGAKILFEHLSQSP